MSQALFGRVVCVRTPLIDDSGWLATVWFVAMDDDEGALEAVRAAGGVSPDDEVLLVGQLEPDAVRRLALAPGQATSWP